MRPPLSNTTPITHLPPGTTARWALLATVIAVGAVAMPAELYPGDPMAMREEARAILLRGEYAITDSIAQHYRDTSEIGQYVVDNPRNGRSYSKYGSMASWFYVLPMAVERVVEGDLPPFVSTRRILYLNIFNVVLSALIATSLHRTAQRFGATPWTATAYVLTCFYATFVWNYLRAQNSEVMQILLFSWAVTSFLDAIDLPARRMTSNAVVRLWSVCTALLMMKVAYVFVGPLFAMGLLAQRIRADGLGWSAAVRREASVHVVPAACCAVIWATNNFVKFGAPWLTGYHVWRPESHGLTGSLADSLPQLFFSVQWGLGFCFPVLLLALPWYSSWLRREPVRYGTLAGVAVTYVMLIGMLPSWRGEMCYGPRYWIFVLPFVALPALDAIRWMASSMGAARFVAIIVAAGLCYSGWLQWQVNRWPFMTTYNLRAPLERHADMSAVAVFSLESYGKIQADMYRSREELSRLQWWKTTKEAVDPRFAARYEQYVREVLSQSNLYWWP
jgi:uncharacterized protein (DUF486 family)